MRHPCCEERRLAAVRKASVLNGIAFLEVSDSDAPSPDLRQRTLFLQLLLPPAGLTADNVIIDGGVRFPTVGVQWVAPATSLPSGEDPALLAEVDDPEHTLVVRTDGTGDHSMYRLRLVATGTTTPPAGFDPHLASIEFSFKVECPTDFDCQTDEPCPDPPLPSPPINYLAKDYESFRTLMLDRMALLAPSWTERLPADVGVTMVELLASVADQLSYRQDAIATEAYLGTARSRVSLRRHAVLVDYTVSEGCNARAWVQVDVNGTGVDLPAGTALVTQIPGADVVLHPEDPKLEAALDNNTVEVFETVATTSLDTSLTSLDFYTWGDLDCCLPIGTTSATLRGAHPTLRAGDVVILTEVLGAVTGDPADADSSHRVAVRLTSVAPGTDPSGGLFDLPLSNASVDVTQIEWDAADALTFPLCLTANDGKWIVAKALGNIVLADHGRTVPGRRDTGLASGTAGVPAPAAPVPGEPLGPIPQPDVWLVPPRGDGCDPPDRVGITPPYCPVLRNLPLTFAGAIDGPVLAIASASTTVRHDLSTHDFSAAVQDWLAGLGIRLAGTGTIQGPKDDYSISDGTTVLRVRKQGPDLKVTGREAPARDMCLIDPRTALPALAVFESATTPPWTVEHDLLDADETTQAVVVEIDTDASAHLRFGDGRNGMMPGQPLQAVYRIGNGTAGNVGAGSIAHIVSADDRFRSVANPLPAAGGVDPETPLAIRRDAPRAYLVQERAVTEDDYAVMAERSVGVSSAAATFRWTGSWHTAFVTTDRDGDLAIDEPLIDQIRNDLERYRMAGYDLEVNAPVHVPLRIDVQICVEATHLRSDVEKVVLGRLGSSITDDGSVGLFNPDSWTFGQPVYLSTVIATAQNVPGVQNVTVNTFARLLDETVSGLDTGVLRMDRLEIAQCNNDPNYPERGVLTVSMGGGR